MQRKCKTVERKLDSQTNNTLTPKCNHVQHTHPHAQEDAINFSQLYLFGQSIVVNAIIQNQIEKGEK